MFRKITRNKLWRWTKQFFVVAMWAIIASTLHFYLAQLLEGKGFEVFTIRLDLFGVVAVAIYYIGRMHGVRMKSN